MKNLELTKVLGLELQILLFLDLFAQAKLSRLMHSCKTSRLDYELVFRVSKQKADFTNKVISISSVFLLVHW